MKKVITELKLMDRQKFSGDLYIDCSGFRAALIEAVMGEPFIPFNDSLFCDKSIAAPIPYHLPCKQYQYP